MVSQMTTDPAVDVLVREKGVILDQVRGLEAEIEIGKLQVSKLDEAIWLLSLAAPADRACWFLPEFAPAGRDLLVWRRGHHKPLGHVHIAHHKGDGAWFRVDRIGLVQPPVLWAFIPRPTKLEIERLAS